MEQLHTMNCNLLAMLILQMLLYVE